ncbi:MAG: phosphate acyltransferase, partial [Gammaproteobacteria bacterium]
MAETSLPEQIVIALDAMGGDHGPAVTVSAALHILDKQSDIKLILVGDETVLAEAIGDSARRLGERLEIQPASQVVSMDELPSQALRG